MIKKLINKYRHMPTAVKASFWFFFCSVLQKGIVVLTVPIITRMLTTAEYGVYSVFISYSNIVLVLGTLSLFSNGYNVGMKRYESDKYQYSSAVLGLMFAITTMLFIVILALHGPIEAYTGLGVFVCVLMFAWIYGQGAVSLCFAKERYEYKYKVIVGCTVFIAVMTPVLKIVLITVFGRRGFDKAYGAILGHVIPVFFAGLASCAIILIKGRKLYNKEYWNFAVRFNIPLIPYYLSQNILNQADRIMIERMESASSAGLYSVAYSAASAVLLVNTAVNSSFIPWQFQKMKQGENKRVAKTVDFLMVVVVAAHLLLIFVAPELMKLFAAKEYAQAVNAIPPVTIGVMLIWLTQIFINVEFYYEKNKLISTSSVISALLNVALNAIAIPRFGYIAASYTTLICYLANMVFHGITAVRLSQKMREDLPFELRNVVLITVGSLAGMFVVLFLYRYPVLRYGVLLVSGVLAVVKGKELVELLRGLFVTIKKDGR